MRMVELNRIKYTHISIKQHKISGTRFAGGAGRTVRFILVLFCFFLTELYGGYKTFHFIFEMVDKTSRRWNHPTWLHAYIYLNIK